jgi:16S rRNA (uracil1498-N3)-methyltransferase
MRLHINSPLVIDGEIRLSEMHGHYLRSVLRLRRGSRITLFNGGGGEYLAEIISLSRHKTSCRILAFDNVDRELPLRIHIVQAACRNEKIESVLQKGTELGAAGFQIVACDRCEATYGFVKR